jgi:hypothetical protein
MKPPWKPGDQKGGREVLPPAVAPSDAAGHGVLLQSPPFEILGPIRAAVESYAETALQPGDRGGLVGVTTWTTDSRGQRRRSTNLAVVQRLGGQSMVVAWIGKSSGWGEFDAGVVLKMKW